MVPGWQAWHLVHWRRPAHHLKVNLRPAGRIEWGSALSCSFALTCKTGGNLPGCICPCITNGLVKGVLWPDKKGSRWAQAKGKGSGQHAGCINEAISPFFLPPPSNHPFLFSLMLFFCMCVCVYSNFQKREGTLRAKFSCDKRMQLFILNECSSLSRTAWFLPLAMLAVSRFALELALCPQSSAVQRFGARGDSTRSSAHDYKPPIVSRDTWSWKHSHTNCSFES